MIPQCLNYFAFIVGKKLGGHAAKILDIGIYGNPFNWLNDEFLFTTTISIVPTEVKKTGLFGVPMITLL